MSTDIHCVAERRQADGTWRSVGRVDLGRNYVLFGILAGLRGGRAIVEPLRGLPGDRDPELCADRDCCGDAESSCDGYHDLGEHSYSWLTLAELRSYDWDGLLHRDGCIPLRDVDQEERDVEYRYESYESWLPHATSRGPRGCCGGISGGVQVLDLRGPDADYDHERVDLASGQAADRALARRLLADHALMPPPEIWHPSPATGSAGELRPCTAWAHVAWREPARDLCPSMIRWLDAHRDDDGDAVRIVFGFDS